MDIRIAGLGTARPRGRIEQEEAATAAAAFCAQSAGQRRTLAALYRRTQVDCRASVLLETSHRGEPHDNERQRFFALPRAPGDRGPRVQARMRAYAKLALPLTLQAAGHALQQAKVDARQIGQLIVISCTGFASPGLDVRLIEALDLPRDVGRTTIGFMGCHGAINGLRVAQSLAQSRGQAVLLCAVELCTLHFQYGWNPQQIVANALFADGAGVLVAMPNEAGGGRSDWVLRDTGSFLVPGSGEAMSWHIGDYGFEMTLSPQVPQIITKHLRPWVEQWLGGRGLGLGDVASWAIHPGGPRVIDAVEAGLGLPAGAGDASRHILQTCGNMSSPTLLFILEHMARQNAKGPCVALAFGPGLMVEAALLGRNGD